MIDRRTFLGDLGLGLALAPLTVEAQQAGKVYRIGYLSPRAGIEYREGPVGRIKALLSGPRLSGPSRNGSPRPRDAMALPFWHPRRALRNAGDQDTGLPSCELSPGVAARDLLTPVVVAGRVAAHSDVQSRGTGSGARCPRPSDR